MITLVHLVLLTLFQLHKLHSHVPHANQVNSVKAMPLEVYRLIVMLVITAQAVQSSDLQWHHLQQEVIFALKDHTALVVQLNQRLALGVTTVLTSLCRHLTVLWFVKLVITVLVEPKLLYQIMLMATFAQQVAIALNKVHLLLNVLLEHIYLIMQHKLNQSVLPVHTVNTVRIWVSQPHLANALRVIFANTQVFQRRYCAAIRTTIVLQEPIL